jgi:hypothetical protein
VVEVEERSLRTLEEDVLPVVERTVDEERGVGDVRAQALRVFVVAGGDLLQLERPGAVHALEPDVLLRQRYLDLLPQDLRVEEVLHTDSESRRLIGVARADPAPRRADLKSAEPAFRGAVDRDVPRHDQVSVTGKSNSLGRDPPGLELVQLLDECAGIDRAAGAQDTLLPSEDARGHVPQLVGRPVGHDRVAGVRAALVAAHEIGVLGEQVDDLALALVAPLRPDDDGRRHGRSLPPPPEASAKGRPPRAQSPPGFLAAGGRQRCQRRAADRETVSPAAPGEAHVCLRTQ